MLPRPASNVNIRNTAHEFKMLPILVVGTLKRQRLTDYLTKSMTSEPKTENLSSEIYVLFEAYRGLHVDNKNHIFLLRNVCSFNSV